MSLTEYMMQGDAGQVPLVFSPIMFSGNPEGNGTAGISPTATTADGVTIPQWIPVLFPVQMPLFLPSLPSNQGGQDAGFYPFPPMIPFYGMAPGAPAGLEFPVPMYVLNT